MYLSVVLDLYNQKVLGYSVSKNIDTELVKRSLCNALTGRRTTGELIFNVTGERSTVVSGLEKSLRRIRTDPE